MQLSGHGAVGHDEVTGLGKDAQDAFAFILDFVQDCMDVRDLATRGQMLGYGDELQRHGIEPLARAGCTLLVARRQARAGVHGRDGTGAYLPLDVIYLVAATAGSQPRKVAVPRDALWNP